MDSKTIREKFIKFFVGRGHKEIAPAKLVPENDPTTLFTSSGMQPLVHYLLGQPHPEGKRLVNSQPSFRAEDIEEVGDNRHTTFFEMLGNWSLGDYFKKEQIPWLWEFLIKELGLPSEKLYVSVFEGNDDVPKDNESYEIYKSLGIPEDHIYFYGVEKNWWSRSGPPDKMPEGEIGGPDSEVFYDFGTEHDPKYGEKCHPNCDCGRFLEIGNSVFIQYLKRTDGSLGELTENNVDFGGGLERLTAATNDNPDIFQTDLFESIIDVLSSYFELSYKEDETATEVFRIVADHMRAAVFLVKNGVHPDNKLQGYVLRRLIRRSAVKMHLLKKGYSDVLPDLVANVINAYSGAGYFTEEDKALIKLYIDAEMQKFEKNLEKGVKGIEKIEKIDGKKAFDLYQTYGFPYEVTEELFRQKGQEIDKEQFRQEFEKHREISRTASAGMFKGGLADHSETVIKYHTATHLLHQALRDVLGPQVFQKGSNITSERLRFDFSYDEKMTEEEVKAVENIINDKIKQDLKVDHMTIPLDEAKKMNAIGLFNEKYAGKVSIYGVGPGYGIDSQAKDQRERGGYYSLEFCGGPHVEQTSVIGKIKIIKDEAISSGMRRIRAQIM